MSPIRALTLALAPEPDAPPLRGFALFVAPGLTLLLAGLWGLARTGDDAIAAADLGGDD